MVIDPPSLFGFALQDGRAWYFVLLAASTATVLLSLNLLRTKTGRAWRAIHGREAVAEALASTSPVAKLSAFIVSLHAHVDGRVSRSPTTAASSRRRPFRFRDDPVRRDRDHRRHRLLLGALLGTLFVVLFPYGIEASMNALGLTERLSSMIFAIN